jgi:hypothetical protein
MPQFSIATEKGERLLMRLFSRKEHAVKNWHARALMIDPKKTKLTLIKTHEIKQVPSWVYRKYAPQQLAPKLK